MLELEEEDGAVIGIDVHLRCDGVMTGRPPCTRRFASSRASSMGDLRRRAMRAGWTCAGDVEGDGDTHDLCAECTRVRLDRLSLMHEIQNMEPPR